MNDQRRSILEDVAEGRLSPEEAVERLDALREELPPRPGTTPGPEGVKRMRIVGVVGTLAIIGDPDVTGGSATGVHRARYEGDALVIEAGDTDSGGWFQERGRHGSQQRQRDDWQQRQRDDWQQRQRDDWQQRQRDDWEGRRGPAWSHGWGGLSGIGRWKTPLEVRMNPDLPLEVDLTAGTVTIRDLRGPVKLDVLVGNVRMHQVTGPLEVGVGSGAVTVRARIAEGSSRVRCEVGNIAVHLEAGSNVQVTGRAHLGKITLPGRDRGFGAGLVEDTAVVGTGEATLDVETSAGAITVTYA